MSSRFKYAASGAGANVEKKVEKKPIQLAWKVRMCGCLKLQICSSVALCSASTAHENGRPWRSHLSADGQRFKEHLCDALVHRNYEEFSEIGNLCLRSAGLCAQSHSPGGEAD